MEQFSEASAESGRIDYVGYHAVTRFWPEYWAQLKNEHLAQDENTAETWLENVIRIYDSGASVSKTLYWKNIAQKCENNINSVILH